MKSTEKPILEWYEELPEPYRSQAMENYDGIYLYARSVYNAILFGFTWADTIQYHRDVNYWSDLADRASSGEFDDPIT